MVYVLYYTAALQHRSTTYVSRMRQMLRISYFWPQIGILMQDWVCSTLFSGQCEVRVLFFPQNLQSQIHHFIEFLTLFVYCCICTRYRNMSFGETQQPQRRLQVTCKMDWIRRCVVVLSRNTRTRLSILDRFQENIDAPLLVYSQHMIMRQKREIYIINSARYLWCWTSDPAPTNAWWW